MPDDQRDLASGLVQPGDLPASPARHRWLSFRRVKLWAKRALATAATLSTAAVAAVIVWQIAAAIPRRHQVSLNPISVPARLASDGMTSAVATQRLLDEIKIIQDRSANSSLLSPASMRQDMSNVTIPKVGLSLDSVAASLRALLPADWVHDVSGEFTVNGDGTTLRLRLNGQLIFTASETGAGAPEKLIADAALKVVEETQPYVAATSLYATRNPATALAVVDRIIAIRPPSDPNVAWAHLLRGVHASDRRGDLQAAAAEYRQALLLDPSFAIAYHNLGLVAMRQGREDEARAMFRRAIALNPHLAYPHIGLALLHVRRGDREAAMVKYREASRAEPQASEPHYRLAYLLSLAGRTDEALLEYRAAVRLAPKSPTAHANLAEFLESRDPETSAAEYRRALEIDPRYGAPRMGLARLLAADGRIDAAVAELRTAISLDPDFVGTHIELGKIWWNQNTHDDAEAEFRAALRVDPEDAHALFNLALIESERGNADAAAEGYRAAIRNDAFFAEPHNNLGAYLFARGDTSGAEREFWTAIRLAPAMPEPHDNLGEIWMGRAAGRTGAERSLALIHACHHFVAAARLGPSRTEDSARVRDVDAAMAGRGRCPPEG